jgi:DNA modification methylase
VSNLVEIAAGVRRVIKPRGTFWVNYGDCYAAAPNGRSAADTKANGEDDRTHRDKPFDTAKASGLKSGNLCLLPERIALAFQAAGWIVRSRIIWGKANTKPDSSGRYRPSYNHEMIWMFSRQMGCHYDATAVRRPTASATKGRLAQNVEGQQGSFRQPGKTNGPFKAVGEQDDRLLRAYEPADVEVWRMATASFEEAHFATFPPELAERCIKAGCPEGGSVLDPFGGAGTTALVAASLGRFPTLIELNPEYCVLARARIEAAFMGKDEGARHMTKQIGKTAADAGPLFAGAVP